MPSRNPSCLCHVHSSVFKRPCRRFFGASGLPSRSAYPPPYLSFLFVVCLMAITIHVPILVRKSSYIDHAKTIANTSIHRRVATTRLRHKSRAATAAAAMHDQARRTGTTGTTGTTCTTCTTWPRSHTKERARAIPHDTPKHNRTDVPMLHHATNTPVGEPPARPLCWGRWDNSRNSARVFEKFAHKT